MCHKTRLQGITALLLGSNPHIALVTQITRVLMHLAESDPAQLVAIQTVPDMIQFFRHHKLIPETLVTAASFVIETNTPGFNSPEALAISFAASIYPQRYSSIVGEDLRSARLKTFIEHIELTLNDNPPHLLDAFDLTRHKLLYVTGNTADPFQDILKNPAAPNPFFDLLLQDLSATSFAKAPLDRAERINGAVLFMYTVTGEIAEKMYSNWITNAPLLKYITLNFSYPPAQMRGLSGSVRNDPVYSRTVMLERVTYSSLQKLRRRNLAPDQIQEEGLLSWAKVYEKLISGFPYFRFWSKLETWWVECLLKHEAKSIPISDTSVTLPVTIEDILEDIGNLRLFLEGYRLVRATFFPQNSTHDEIEAHRKKIDIIYSHFLSDDHSNMAKLIADASAETGFPPSKVNTILYRLKNRLLAYLLSRVMNFPNTVIKHITILEQVNKYTVHRVQPLLNEPAIFAITSIARLAAPNETLLPAFFTYIALQPKVFPQHPDVWTLPDYICELYQWIGAGKLGIEEPLKRMTNRTCSFYAELYTEALPNGAFHKLIADLRTIKTAQSLINYSRNPFPIVAAGVNKLMHNRFCGSATGMLATELSNWKASVQNAGTHWIPPTFFLVFIEALELNILLYRLIVDKPELKQVTGLAQFMIACRPPCRGMYQGASTLL